MVLKPCLSPVNSPSQSPHIYSAYPCLKHSKKHRNFYNELSMSSSDGVGNHKHTPEDLAKLDEVENPPDVATNSTVLLLHRSEEFKKLPNCCLTSRKSDGRRD